MIPFVFRLVRLLNLALPSRQSLILEDLSLRQQLAVCKRSGKRPRLRQTDRVFWVWLSRCWAGWRSVIDIVRPKTVLAWHRQGFRRYWRWKSRPLRRTSGRPPVTPEISELIRTMKQANSLWGAPRIHGELLKLGFEVSERTISRLLPKSRQPPSQSWRVFLTNHASDLVALDFFTVPTISFHVLYVFVVLSLERRRVVQFNVAANPTAFWTGPQMIEAFPEDTAPRYLLRDRDGIYGDEFRDRVEGMGVKEVLTAPRSPWQNAFAERLIGSIRRECLDHVIVLNRKHLRRILKTISVIIIDRERTWDWTRKLPSSGRCKVRNLARWWSFLKWAGCTTATNAAPPRGNLRDHESEPVVDWANGRISRVTALDLPCRTLAARAGSLGTLPHGHTKNTGSLTNPVFFLIGYRVLARDSRLRSRLISVRREQIRFKRLELFGHQTDTTP